MKKLLSMLGAITLIGTASTNLVACGGEENRTPPTSDTRTDISTKITSPIDLGQLYANTNAAIIGIGSYKDEITLNYQSINFKNVTGWQESNGAVCSLTTTANGDVYAGTSTVLLKEIYFTYK